MFERIRKWYAQGLWTNEMVKQAAEKGIITDEQCAEILAEEG